MVNAIIGRHVLNQKGIDALQAADVVAVLFRVRTALVVGVDAAHRAEEVLRGVGVEFITRERRLTLDNPDTRQRDGRHDCPFATADRAVAAAWIHHTIG